MHKDLVEAFLYSRPGARFCSECIGREIGLTSIEAFTAANTARIHRRHLHVDLSACTGCGTTKGVFWSE